MLPPSAWLAITIAGLSLITEDGATALAAGSAGRVIGVRLAFISCFLGIWAGDLGLYATARGMGRKLLAKSIAQRFLPEAKLNEAERWFQQRGLLALIASRIIPGTRLPTYLAAGFLKMPFPIFAAVTAACAAGWVGVALWIAQSLPSLSPPSNSTDRLAGVALPALLLALALAVARPTLVRAAQTVRTWWRKYSRWEFWPAWLFYAPVVAMGAWLGFRYRGVALPTIANPSQRNGGLIGESKIAVLAELMKTAPEFVADAYLIPAAPPNQRMHLLEIVLQDHGIGLPFVLKPDVGQRGAGFRIVHNLREAQEYLARVEPSVILQRYAAGPQEAGVFYYRLPGDSQGQIFAITEKSFPVLAGDGASTLRELIAADERASLMAETYLSRHAAIADRVIPAGESIRLVEAGNHCQGCIFQDGMHLYSEPLREAIDRISQGLPEFYIGRYDVRYASADELCMGRGFTIIELNGSASEATSIYDSRNSLWSAYQTLYRQWQLVYRIGQMNRARGYRPAGIASVVSDLFTYRSLAAFYPAAD